MSHRTLDEKAVIVATGKQKCELCSKQAETRPYGPRGENICFACGMKDEKVTGRQFMRSVFGEVVQ